MFLAGLLTFTVCSCGGPESPAAASPPLSSQSTPAVPEAAQNSGNQSQSFSLARMRVVDLEGNPVRNMLPIATQSANAFEKPIAQGQPTGADGLGSLMTPNDAWVYVRAWDPAKRMFANNYYDVPPGEARQTDVMEIVMAPGASLRAEILDAEGKPVAGQFVGIMMEHPTQGPWWPDESQTDSTGKIVFESVPPGKFLITFETRDGRQVQVPGVALDPGGATNIGPVILR